MAASGMKPIDRVFRVWTVIVLIFLYAPIVAVVVFSFNKQRLNTVWTGFTLSWYGKLLHDRALLDSAYNSMIIAGATTIVSTFLGTIGAWLLHQYRYRFQKAIDMLILIPVVMPEIIMGISLLIFFAVASNLGNAVLERLANVTSNPLGLGYATVVISHVTFCFPFVLIPVRARLAGADPALMEAAMDLGATPSRAFWSVMVPYLMPAIIAGGLMAFTLSLDELIITYFTTGPNSATLPLKIFGLAKKGVDPSINAVSSVLILITAVLVVAVQYLWKPHPQTTPAAE